MVGAIALILSSLSLPAARAQDGEAAQQDEPARPLAWADGHRWVRQGVRGSIEQVAITPDGDTLAMDDEGRVYRETSSGWAESLGPYAALGEDSDEESLLIEAEGVLDETLGGDEGLNEDDPDADPVEAFDRLGDLDQEARDRQQDERGTVSLESTELFLWVSQLYPGTVIAVRPDGAWWSGDGGTTWRLADTELVGVRTMLEVPEGNGLIIAGTAQGLRYSADGGQAWIAVEGDIGRAEVNALVEDETGIYAGTSWGLLFSEDGLNWTWRQAQGMEVRSVTSLAMDPAWEGGIWLVGPSGVLRSDDGGQTVRQLGLNPLQGARHIYRLPAVGHLLVVGSDGVWESVDGGVKWRPLPVGLARPPANMLAQAPEGPLLATPDGLYRLVRVKPGAAVAEVGGPAQPAPELGDVVEHALNRAGVSFDALEVQRNLVASLAMPKLTIDIDHDDNWTKKNDYEGQTSRLDTESNWSFGLQLCFGSCSGATYVEDYEPLDSYIIGDEVYLDDDSGSLTSGAANVAERVTKYRINLADEVSELYFSRDKLLAERDGLSGLPLDELVDIELEILEIEARLDVFTDGYFTLALRGS